MVTELLPIIIAATEESAEEAGGIGALGLDPLAILAQAVTFLLLFWVIKRFALEKIVNSLEERRKTIDSGVLLGLEMQAEKEKLETRVEEMLQKAHLQADGVLADAQREAGSIIHQAEESARARVESMLNDAHARIEDDVQKAKHELEKETIRLIADATEIIIAEKLDERRDNALIEKALKGVRER